MVEVSPALDEPPMPADLDFETVYREEFAFVWRSLRHLGVSPPDLDDAAQDVFLVVHRKLDGYDGVSPIRAWLFAIAHLVALTYSRRERRKGGLAALPGGLQSPAPSPHERTEGAEAAEFLGRFLDTLDDARRAVFVMADVEQLSAPEISVALSVRLNTVYSRLRAARVAFQRAVDDHMRGKP
jgi:RNA polymerase sigma-70 factor, ECF subfamily